MSENQGFPTWQFLEPDEFAKIADSNVGKIIANNFHIEIYGKDTEHNALLPCPCSHRAVDLLLQNRLLRPDRFNV